MVPVRVRLRICALRSCPLALGGFDLLQSVLVPAVPPPVSRARVAAARAWEECVHQLRLIRPSSVAVGRRLLPPGVVCLWQIQAWLSEAVGRRPLPARQPPHLVAHLAHC